MSGDWIEEQKKNRLFRGGLNTGNDADKMLRWGDTNRDLSVEQARKFTATRAMGIYFCLPSVTGLVDMFEKAQLCVNAKSREDFKQVAIEQWQGKLDKLKGKITLENVV